MEQQRASEYLFKLILVGDSSAGKSDLLQNFTSNALPSENREKTIGIEFGTTTLQLDQRIVKLQIWNTDGQERFRSITSAYYRNTHAIFLIFNTSSEKSFSDVTHWHQTIIKVASPDCKMILVGHNLNPEKRVIGDIKAQALADRLKIPYLCVKPQENRTTSKLLTLTANLILKSNTVAQNDKPIRSVSQKINQSATDSNTIEVMRNTFSRGNANNRSDSYKPIFSFSPKNRKYIILPDETTLASYSSKMEKGILEKMEFYCSDMKSTNLADAPRACLDDFIRDNLFSNVISAEAPSNSRDPENQFKLICQLASNDLYATKVMLCIGAQGLTSIVGSFFMDEIKLDGQSISFLITRNNKAMFFKSKDSKRIFYEQLLDYNCIMIGNQYFIINDDNTLVKTTLEQYVELNNGENPPKSFLTCCLLYQIGNGLLHMSAQVHPNLSEIFTLKNSTDHQTILQKCRNQLTPFDFYYLGKSNSQLAKVLFENYKKLSNQGNWTPNEIDTIQLLCEQEDNERLKPDLSL